MLCGEKLVFGVDLNEGLLVAFFIFVLSKSLPSMRGVRCPRDAQASAAFCQS